MDNSIFSSYEVRIAVAQKKSEIEFKAMSEKDQIEVLLGVISSLYKEREQCRIEQDRLDKEREQTMPPLMSILGSGATLGALGLCGAGVRLDKSTPSDKEPVEKEVNAPVEKKVDSVPQQESVPEKKDTPQEDIAKVILGDVDRKIRRMRGSIISEVSNAMRKELNEWKTGTKQIEQEDIAEPTMLREEPKEQIGS